MNSPTFTPQRITLEARGFTPYRLCLPYASYAVGAQVWLRPSLCVYGNWCVCLDGFICFYCQFHPQEFDALFCPEPEE